MTIAKMNEQIACKRAQYWKMNYIQGEGNFSKKTRNSRNQESINPFKHKRKQDDNRRRNYITPSHVNGFVYQQKQQT